MAIAQGLPPKSILTFDTVQAAVSKANGPPPNDLACYSRRKTSSAQPLPPVNNCKHALGLSLGLGLGFRLGASYFKVSSGLGFGFRVFVLQVPFHALDLLVLCNFSKPWLPEPSRAGSRVGAKRSLVHGTLEASAASGFQGCWSFGSASLCRHETTKSAAGKCSARAELRRRAM